MPAVRRRRRRPKAKATIWNLPAGLQLGLALAQRPPQKTSKIDVASLPMPEGPWFVYMIANRAGQTYVGSTTDPLRRAAEHNRETGHVGRGAKATTKGLIRGGRTADADGELPPPSWRLVYVEGGLADRSAALKRERAVKFDFAMRVEVRKSFEETLRQIKAQAPGPALAEGGPAGSDPDAHPPGKEKPTRRRVARAKPGPGALAALHGIEDESALELAGP